MSYFTCIRLVYTMYGIETSKTNSADNTFSHNECLHNSMTAD